MLNPIDTDAVIRDGHVAGTFPGEIHQGVAWWVASCFVVTSTTHQLAVAHDGHPTTAEFHRSFCRRAINAQRFACRVSDLGTADQIQLLQAVKSLGETPGALLTTTEEGSRQLVTIRLYDAHGQQVTDNTGLAWIRDMIDADHVPIPVNAQARGRITAKRSVASTSATPQTRPWRSCSRRSRKPDSSMTT
ncbi:hypothetical protein ACIRPT_27275 [Streptomyces sp. NPDC101227]|uniref:hypothetical protein n=1 Tax=Streptomyces sp. NPDC101227 TaxID=3366136 RepID=UPI00380258B2